MTDLLSNVNGLSGLTALESLAIVENASLPTCEAEWLRDHIGVENLESVAIDGNDDAVVCVS